MESPIRGALLGGKPGRKLRSFPACGGEGEGDEGEGGGGVAEPEGNRRRLRRQGRLEGGETRQKVGEACGGGMEGCDGAAGAVRDEAGVVGQGDSFTYFKGRRRGIL